MNRRSFLKLCVASTVLSFYPAELIAQTFEVRNQFNAQIVGVPTNQASFWEAPRELWLARKETGEQIKLTYWQNGKVDQTGYSAACHVLRDVKFNKKVDIDLRLLDILRAIQGFLVYNNIHQPIIVTSGYRTQENNSSLEGAAKNSMHLYGCAADILIPGIPPKYLAELAKIFRGGGVGFYVKKNIVHIDTGRVRFWKG